MAGNLAVVLADGPFCKDNDAMGQGERTRAQPTGGWEDGRGGLLRLIGLAK